MSYEKDNAGCISWWHGDQKLVRGDQKLVPRPLVQNYKNLCFTKKGRKYLHSAKKPAGFSQNNKLKLPVDMPIQK